ncbi:ead/Ea22-like family protein [Salmonella enterica]|nr:ead/Ea22-like family protein [Salmonella enterica]MDR5456228.1 ead/Ea22-like family protein [Salmonella enterica subsp. enterica serovar Apeyeme]MDJ3669564.1 ead/Ea22-like family protein [Salmonella enterica]MDJ6982479.1 ead/Ea22-like family protein [Salmonella enterica]MDJ7233699.1 ead/Ea22-like family protein [Salmonella enterica]
MSEIDYQSLRDKAEKATCGVWSLEYGEGRFDGDDALIHREAAGYLPICRIEGAHPESGFDEDFQMEQQANAEFIAAANPATVLALLDERERNQQYIKRRDQENEDIALTVGKLRVELEAAENNLIDSECHVAELEEALRDKQALLEASEKRIAELEAEPVSQDYKLNALDGNSPVTPDGWISCSERMPENIPGSCKEYLVFDGLNNKVHHDYWVVPDGDSAPVASFWNHYGAHVTHWMPLPEPPQEAK